MTGIGVGCQKVSAPGPVLNRTKPHGRHNGWSMGHEGLPPADLLLVADADHVGPAMRDLLNRSAGLPIRSRSVLLYTPILAANPTNHTWTIMDYADTQCHPASELMPMPKTPTPWLFHEHLASERLATPSRRPNVVVRSRR